MAFRRRIQHNPDPAGPGQDGKPRFERIRGRLGVALVILGVAAEAALVVFALVYFLSHL